MVNRYKLQNIYCDSRTTYDFSFISEILGDIEVTLTLIHGASEWTLKKSQWVVSYPTIKDKTLIDTPEKKNKMDEEIKEYIRANNYFGCMYNTMR